MSSIKLNAPYFQWEVMRRQRLEKLKLNDRNKTTVSLLVIDEIQGFFEKTRPGKIDENDV